MNKVERYNLTALKLWTLGGEWEDRTPAALF